MVDGTISVNQARAMLGKKALPPPRRRAAAYGAPQRQGAMAVKAAGGTVRPASAVTGGSQPGPSRPALERQAYLGTDPWQRETARDYLAEVDGGARNWVPPLPGLVREAEGNPDPRQREACRADLQKSLARPEQAAGESVRMLAWGAGPHGDAGWQFPSQPAAPGLRIAVPGTAGR